MATGAAAFVAGLGLATAGAGAQSATMPLSLDKVVLSGEAAKHALTTTEINADTAERIVRACVDYAAAHGSGASIFVLSPSGDIVHSHRMDGQTPNNIDSAFRKAKTALYMRTSTREALNRWNTLEAQIVRADIGLYLNPGGLPIIVNDQLIGAVGVGGAAVGDEQCAYEALTKVLGPQPPLAPAKPFGGIGNEAPPPAAPGTSR